MSSLCQQRLPWPWQTDQVVDWVLGGYLCRISKLFWTLQRDEKLGQWSVTSTGLARQPLSTHRSREDARMAEALSSNVFVQLLKGCLMWMWKNLLWYARTRRLQTNYSPKTHSTLWSVFVCLSWDDPNTSFISRTEWPEIAASKMRQYSVLFNEHFLTVQMLRFQTSKPFVNS